MKEDAFYEKYIWRETLLLLLMKERKKRQVKKKTKVEYICI